MDFKLHSMKIDKAEAEKLSEPSKADLPRYPWGLSLNLDDETIKKLGLDKLPDVDTPMLLAARVNVTGTSSNASTGDKKRRSLTLQITEMGLEDEPKKKAAEDVLYGEGEK